MSEGPTFIVDSMLGTLAKWLRILGFDTLYFRAIDDNELIRISRQQQRILLTKDNQLAKKRIDKYILISSDKLFDQLKEVLSIISHQKKLSLNLFSRCIKCNGELAEVDKKMIFNEVPEFVYRKYESFFRCTNCGNVYWEGTHKDMIDKTIKELLKDSGLSLN